MSDQEYYDIASQRITRRNRRWTLWAFDLAGLIICVAALVFMSETPYVNISVGVMLAWTAVFIVHTFIVAMAHNHDEDIEKEVAKLRGASYEKPKRLRLADDGELLIDTDHEHEEAGFSQ